MLKPFHCSNCRRELGHTDGTILIPPPARIVVVTPTATYTMPKGKATISAEEAFVDCECGMHRKWRELRPVPTSS